MFVEIREAYSPKFFLELVQEVAKRCEHEKLNKVLIDTKAMSSSININILERFQLGLEIAKVWGPKLRVACVARPELVNRMAENTAVNRGAFVRAFLHEEEALLWLEIKKQNEDKGA